MELGKVGSALGSLPSLGGKEAAGGNFGEILKTMATQVVDSQKQAEAMSIAAANGDAVALHEVIQAVSRAELTLQTLVTVRDRAVEAYQQIMQMPV